MITGSCGSNSRLPSLSIPCALSLYDLWFVLLFARLRP
jgi:hypothetical protein